MAVNERKNYASISEFVPKEQFYNMNSSRADCKPPVVSPILYLFHHLHEASASHNNM